MKTKTTNYKFNRLMYLLLLLPLLLLTYCQEGVINIAPNNEMVITKDSKIVALMTAAVSGTSFAKSGNEESGNDESEDEDDDDSDNEDQCVEFQYPFAFYALFENSVSIETIVISGNQDLLDFFNQLTSTDKISIDFPVYLLGSDGSVTEVGDLKDLEDTLEIAIDACENENDDYEYCDDNHKKVNICHNGHTICVSVNAIKAHLDHGDELGKCDDDD
jgi:hypothetical protein